MKKILLGVFALLMLSVLTSCDHDGDSGQNGNTNSRDDWKIKLNASVYNALTKAGPINSNFTTNFSVGVYANTGSWLAGSSANFINNDIATVAGASGHAITFGSGPYYYQNATPTNFYLYSPSGTESTPAGAGVSPKVSITINGQQDVMWATGVGSKYGSAAATPPTLALAHKLTQLQFTFKSGTNFPASGSSVTSLLVKAQPTTLIMTVDTGSFTSSGSADMQALSTANQTAGIGITTAGANANSPVMTTSSSGTTAYYLDIVVKTSGGTSFTYTAIPVNVNTAVGSAQMITVTFNDVSVAAAATVADWAAGSAGSATAQ